MARRFHLFPFRTEKLSFATPMVLRTSGRVGSRRLTESLEAVMLRGFFCALTGTGNDISCGLSYFVRPLGYHRYLWGDRESFDSSFLLILFVSYPALYRGILG